MTTRTTTKRYSSFIGVVLASLALISAVLAVPAQADFTQIYFLRHAEIDKKTLISRLLRRVVSGLLRWLSTLKG